MLLLRAQEVEKQHLPGFVVKNSFSVFNVSEEVRIYGLLFDLEFPWESRGNYLFFLIVVFKGIYNARMRLIRLA